MKKKLGIVVRILICAIIEFLLFWFKLPPINLRSKDFWGFIVESIIICTVVFAISAIISFIKDNNGNNGQEVLVNGKTAFKGSAKPFKIASDAVTVFSEFLVLLYNRFMLFSSLLFFSKHNKQDCADRHQDWII